MNKISLAFYPVIKLEQQKSLLRHCLELQLKHILNRERSEWNTAELKRQSHQKTRILSQGETVLSFQCFPLSRRALILIWTFCSDKLSIKKTFWKLVKESKNLKRIVHYSSGMGLYATRWSLKWMFHLKGHTSIPVRGFTLSNWLKPYVKKFCDRYCLGTNTNKWASCHLTELLFILFLSWEKTKLKITFTILTGIALWLKCISFEDSTGFEYPIGVHSRKHYCSY